MTLKQYWKSECVTDPLVWGLLHMNVSIPKNTLFFRAPVGKKKKKLILSTCNHICRRSGDVKPRRDDTNSKLKDMLDNQKPEGKRNSTAELLLNIKPEYKVN